MASTCNAIEPVLEHLEDLITSGSSLEECAQFIKSIKSKFDSTELYALIEDELSSITGRTYRKTVNSLITMLNSLLEDDPVSNAPGSSPNEDSKEKDEIRTDYLNPYFGIDTLGKSIYLNLTTRSLVFTFLLNKREHFFIRNNLDLNDSIHAYQSSLLEKILDYLNKYYEDGYNLVLKLISDNGGNPIESDEVMKGIFKVIDPIFRNRKLFGRSVTSTLGTDHLLPSATALGAYITLRHFDSIINDLFSEIIDIADKFANGQFTSEIKYRLNPKNANILEWRDDAKDYNELEEIGNLNALLLSVMPNYEYILVKEDGTITDVELIVPGSYYSLQRLAKAKAILQHLCTAKSAMFTRGNINYFIDKTNENTWLADVVENFYDLYEEPYDASKYGGLSVREAYLLGKLLIPRITRIFNSFAGLSVAEAVAKMGENMRVYAPIVMYMLVNKHIKNLDLKNEEKNLLLTLYKNLYDPSNISDTGVSSLITYGLLTKNSDYNYYDFLNLAVKTLLENALLTYLYSPEFGIGVSYLTDQSSSRHFFKFRRLLLANNSISRKYQHPLINITNNYEEKDFDPSKFTVTVYFKNDLEFTVTCSTGSKNKDGMSIDVQAVRHTMDGKVSKVTNLSTSELALFFSHYLGLPTDVINLLESYGITSMDLLKLCSTIIYKTEISKLATLKKGKITVDDFRTFALGFNLGKDLVIERGSILELEPTSKAMYPTIYKIANAVASLLHADPKSTANDNSGKQVGISGISSLHANQPALVLRRRLDDPSRALAENKIEVAEGITEDWEGFLFNLVYKGDAMIRDTKGTTDVKAATKMNFNELYIANFLYDYYGARLDSTMGSSTYGDIKLGDDAEALFMGMIISDKSNFEKLRIGLNREVKVPGINKKKKIGELTTSDVKKIIKTDLGCYYKNVRSLIHKLCELLSKYLPYKFDDAYEEDEVTGERKGELSFLEWNEGLASDAKDALVPDDLLNPETLIDLYKAGILDWDDVSLVITKISNVLGSSKAFRFVQTALTTKNTESLLRALKGIDTSLEAKRLDLINAVKETDAHDKLYALYGELNTKYSDSKTGIKSLGKDSTLNKKLYSKLCETKKAIHDKYMHEALVKALADYRLHLANLVAALKLTLELIGKSQNLKGRNKTRLKDLILRIEENTEKGSYDAGITLEFVDKYINDTNVTLNDIESDIKVVSEYRPLFTENLIGNWNKKKGIYIANPVLNEILERNWDTFFELTMDLTITDLILKSPILDVSKKDSSKVLAAAATANTGFISKLKIAYCKIKRNNLDEKDSVSAIITCTLDFLNWKLYLRVTEALTPNSSSSRYLTITPDLVLALSTKSLVATIEDRIDDNKLEELELEYREDIMSEILDIRQQIIEENPKALEDDIEKLTNARVEKLVKERVNLDYSNEVKAILLEYLNPTNASFNIRTALDIISTYSGHIFKQSRGAYITKKVRENYEKELSDDNFAQLEKLFTSYTEEEKPSLIEALVTNASINGVNPVLDLDAYKEKLVIDPTYFESELKLYRVGKEREKLEARRKRLLRNYDDGEYKFKEYQDKLSTDITYLYKLIAKLKAYEYASQFELYLKTGETSTLLNVSEEIRKDPALLSDYIASNIVKYYNGDLNYLVEKDHTYYYEINPNIAHHTLLDQWFFNEHSILSVGSFINHPGDTLQKRVAALVKRNVVNTGGKLLYDTSNPNGASRTCRIAVIDDKENVVFNTMGKLGYLPTYDGGTFTCGVLSILENISLGNAKVGINKKPLFHGINEYGLGIIIKTAGFDVNNNMIRRSEELGRLNKQMLGLKWDTEVDITKDFFGEDLFLPVEDENGHIPEYGKYGAIYYWDGKNHWLITGITKVNEKSLTYTVTKQQVNEDGSIKYDSNHRVITSTDETVIDSNYALWKLFGGEFSEHLAGKKLTYVNDNSSMEKVAIACNNVGYVKSYRGQVYKSMLTLDDVDLVLKRHLVCYMVGAGAIKQGAANMNSTEILTKDDYEATTMEFTLEDGGVQLDAEHHSEDSVLSLMTLVVNALSARGYSTELAEKVYTALRHLTRLSLGDCFDGLEKYLKNPEDAVANAEFREAISAIIVLTLKHTSSTDGNALNAISLAIKEEAKKTHGKYKLILGRLPLSNANVFNLLMSLIASSLSKSAIKLKPPGVMCVLVPSDGLIKLYDGDTLDLLFATYKTTSLKVIKEKLLKKSLKLSEALHIADINFEANYFILDTQTGLYITDFDKHTSNDPKSIKIDTPLEYYKLRELLKNDPDRYQLFEDKSEGRNLAASKVTFTIDGEKFNIWDLDSVRGRFFVESGINLMDVINILNEYNFVGNELIPTDPNEYKDFIKRNKKDILKFLLVKHLEELNALGSGTNYEVLINGESKLVDKSTVQIKGYEGIMPKVYSKEFGLVDGDSVKLISEDRLFFLRRMALNFKGTCAPEHYHLAIRGMNPKDHVYLWYDSKGAPVPKDLTKQELPYIVEGNLIYRVDSSNNKLYQLPPISNSEGIPVPNVELYTDKDGNEIFVTKNLAFFLNQCSGTYVLLSSSVAKNFEGLAKAEGLELGIISELEKCEKRNVKSLYEHITSFDEGSEDSKIPYNQLLYNRLVKLSSDIENGLQTLEKATDLHKLHLDSAFLRHMKDSALEMHTSFLKSLEILAARIPSQSLQSFMSMNIVGFDDSGVNNAHVSRWLLWLLGSDFDIDKVSLLGSCFEKGKYVTWSPFMSLLNLELLHASETLEFPTGISIKDLTLVTFDQNAEANGGDANIWSYINKEYDYYKERDNSGKVTAITFIFPKSNIKIRATVDTDGTYILNEDVDISQLPSYDLFLIKNAIATRLSISTKSIGPISNAVKNIGNNISRFDEFIASSITPAEVEILKNKDWDLRKFRHDHKGEKDVELPSVTSALMHLSTIVTTLNRMKAFPHHSFLSLFSRDVIDLVDEHNTYSDKLNAKKATINIVSSNMYLTSKDPVNYILGMISVDATTDRIKSLANKLAAAMKSKLFDEKTITTRIQLLLLTAEGKLNVGISASSLKVFEGISYYVYKVLNLGSPEELLALLYNLEIAGIPYHILANAHAKFKGNVDDTDIQIGDYTLSVKDVLDDVDLFEDAFIMISTFLSLAADNAKDPTLSKLNAGPDMLGLYTAGVMIGVPIETLIPIMTSDTGLMILKQLSGNIFNDEKGSSKVINAINYLTSDTLHIEQLPQLKNTVKILISVANLLGANIEISLDASGAKLLSSFSKAFFLLSEYALNKIILVIKALTRPKNKVREALEELDITSDYTLIIKNLVKGLSHSKRSKSFFSKLKELDKKIEIVELKLADDPSNKTLLNERKRLLHSLDVATAKQEAFNGNLEYLKGISEAIETADDSTAFIKSEIDKVKSDEAYSTYESKHRELAKISGDLLRNPDSAELLEKVEKLKKEEQNAKKLAAPMIDRMSLLTLVLQSLTNLGIEIDNFINEDFEEKKVNIETLNDLVEELEAKRYQRELINHDYLKDNNGDTIYDKEGKPIKVSLEITKLALASEELAILRTLILNLELPNAVADQLSFIRYFETIIKNKGVDPENPIVALFIEANKSSSILDESSNPNFDASLLIDTQRWIIDEDYRELCKLVLDTAKIFINPLRIIDSVEHFKGYLESALLLYNFGKTASLVYRTSDIIMRDLLSEMPILANKDKVRMAKSIQGFVIHKATESYLASSDFTFKTKIPGLDELITLTLRTPLERLAFMDYMEEVYIPKLKELYAFNPFVKELTLAKEDRNAKHRTVLRYKLNKSSMPKDDTELRAFLEMKAGLNSLTKNTIDDLPYKPIEMLYLYNLVSCDGAPGEFNLTGLFEDLNVSGEFPLMNDLNDFISRLDFEGKLVSGETFSKGELLAYIAPQLNDYEVEKTPYSKFWLMDDTTLVWYLVDKAKTEKTVNDEEMDDDPNNAELESLTLEQLDSLDNLQLEMADAMGIDISEGNESKYLKLTIDKKIDKLNESNSGYTYSQSSIVDVDSILIETPMKVGGSFITRLLFKGSSLALEYPGVLSYEDYLSRDDWGSDFVIRYKGIEYKLGDLLTDIDHGLGEAIYQRFGRLIPKLLILVTPLTTYDLNSGETIDDASKAGFQGVKIDGLATLYHLKAMLKDYGLRNSVVYNSLKEITGAQDIHIEASMLYHSRVLLDIPKPLDIIGANLIPYLEKVLKAIKYGTTTKQTYATLEDIFDFLGQSVPEGLDVEKLKEICVLAGAKLSLDTGLNVEIIPIGKMAIVKASKFVTKADMLALVSKEMIVYPNLENMDYLMNYPLDGTIDESALATVLSDMLLDAYKYLGVNINTTTTSDLLDMINNGELPFLDASLVNAFIYNGEVYINLDKANMDAPLHEMSHILMGILKFTNPTMYNQMLDIIVNSPSLKRLLKDYPNRTLLDAAEEILVDNIAKAFAGLSTDLENLSGENRRIIINNFTDALNRLLSGLIAVECTEDNMKKIFNESLITLMKKVHSDRLQTTSPISYLGSIAEVHRTLANIKQDLMKNKMLLETCKP